MREINLLINIRIEYKYKNKSFKDAYAKRTIAISKHASACVGLVQSAHEVACKRKR